MPADTSILMGFRGPQIESQDALNARAAQQMVAQQQNMLGAMQLGEMARANKQKQAVANALANIDPNTPPNELTKLLRNAYITGGDLKGLMDFDKTAAEAEAAQAKVGKEKALTKQAEAGTAKTEFELQKKQYDHSLTQLSNAHSVEEYIARVNEARTKKYMSPEQADAALKEASEARARDIMEGGNKNYQMLRRSYIEKLIDAKDRLTREEPKYEFVDIGGKKERIQTNPHAEGFNATQTELVKTPTISETETARHNRVMEGQGRVRLNKDTSEAPKLNKGERWNAEKGRVETIPGSDLYVKQSDKHGKDFQALQGVDTKVDSAINKIDYILSPENKSGFEANFGGYNAYLAGRIPGKATDIRKNIDSLKSDLKATGLELMRSGGSIGQITEREWPIIEGMIGALSPEMSEDEARLQFGKIKTYMNRIRTNAREAYDTEWGGSQYHKEDKKPPSPPAASASKNVPRTNSKGWLLHTDAKGNQAYVSPDGKSIEEVKK